DRCSRRLRRRCGPGLTRSNRGVLGYHPPQAVRAWEPCPPCLIAGGRRPPATSARGLHPLPPRRARRVVGDHVPERPELAVADVDRHRPVTRAWNRIVITPSPRLRWLQVVDQGDYGG